MKRAERATALVGRLRAVYPDARCELDHSGPLQLLVATILSAQCTDRRVNEVTRALFRRCRTARDYATIPAPELEALIRPTGFFRAKAKNLKGMAVALLRDHGGKVPATMDALTRLPGVGRKTANVVLGNAFGRSDGVVVDTHVGRLARRLGLTRQSDPEKVETDLMRAIPRTDWTLFSHWLIWHGRRRCAARKPDCPGCELADLCPSAGKLGTRPRPPQK